ncbi:cytochrome P450 4C1 [Monomorium pharaonis]|uniref:cytochrome P450 4C1 n=1 Tax=Monomorium pharaonis TaxID=307658 RepID=UPI001746DA7B|nr:cytochrome P450 4C1 [Monomorium pharaonis]XP_036145806.1 cytochrome P450 4C1 [Monomorium pharaonis]XP_036145807.1 cytochrome P450 4C1 [Monomorium pharaonis]
MFIIILLLFIPVVYLARYYYVHNGQYGRLFHKIPGPSSYPIIGHLLLVLCSREELWKLLLTLSTQYYPIFKAWVFLYGFVSIQHPDDLEIILSSTKNIDKSMIYEIFHPWLGMGLLTSGGSKWHSRRKILTPTFHFNILQQFIEILVEEGESMTRSLKNAGGIVTKDLEPFISEHTLNAICETAMGTSLQEMNAFQQQYRKAVHRMGELFVHRLFRPWLHVNWIYSLTPKGKEQKNILKILHGFTEKIIAKRKNYHKCTDGQYLRNFDKETMADDTETTTIKKKRLAMLDLLILASQEGLLTDLDIREEIDTFTLEGHDTTSMAICFTLCLLAEHKDIQNCVREEVDTIMKENKGNLTMKSLQDLQYLERCIKEALRIYPSVFFISRVNSEEVQLKSYIIPARTIIHLNIVGVHRDPNFWPNPEIFDPDRFLPDNIKNRHPYSYIPFSAGPRNCIGQRFALLEMKAMIAPLIHNFYIEPVDYLKDLRPIADFVFRPLNPLRLKFIPVVKKCI